MSYETWVMLNNVGIVGVLVIPIVLAVVVFLRQRRPRSADGRTMGRPVAWALATIVGSFIALVVAWGLLLQERYPDYVARHDAEYQGSEETTDSGSSDNRDVVAGVVGSWRPNNANRSDYFTFTANTYASVNPEFDTTITYGYDVILRDGSCMRIRNNSVQVVQSGEIVRNKPARGTPFFVCVDPQTGLMAMRFANDTGDVFFTRMD